MIKVDSGETFYIVTTLVDKYSMGSGCFVSYSIKDVNDVVISSGTLTEDTTYSGVYSKSISIEIPGNYKVFYVAKGYPTGVENIIVVEESLSKLIKQTRQWNLATENVLATSNIPKRNVAIGETNYIIIRIKNDADINWDNPVREEKIYAWYKTMGDNNPYYMGESN